MGELLRVAGDMTEDEVEESVAYVLGGNNAEDVLRAFEE